MAPKLRADASSALASAAEAAAVCERGRFMALTSVSTCSLAGAQSGEEGGRCVSRLPPPISARKGRRRLPGRWEGWVEGRGCAGGGCVGAYLALHARQQLRVDVLEQLAAAHVAHPLAELALHLLLVPLLLVLLGLLLVLQELLRRIVGVCRLQQLHRVQLPQPRAQSL